MAVDKFLEIYDEQGNPVDYDIRANDVKFPDGESLPDKLAEIESDVEAAGQVNDIKVGSETYSPTNKTIDLTDAFAGKQDVINDLADIRAGAAAGATALQPGDDVPATDVTGLATVATSGSYNDLSNKPNLSDYYNKAAVNSLLSGKVDKVTGKGLSTNDYTDADKTKLAGLPTASELNEIIEDIEAGDVVITSIENVQMVDSHSNNSVLVAPTARQMKMMYDNMMAIFNGLANTAFVNGKPTLDWIGEKNQYTLALSLTGCTANVSAGDVDEGALTIRLTPTSGYSIAQLNVKDGSNNDVAYTRTDGSGYTDITFVVRGNVAVTCVAVDGYVVSLNGAHLSINNHSVQHGSTYNGILSADTHWNIPTTIEVAVGGVTLQSGYTYDNTTGAISIPNVTDNVAITAVAVEDAKYTVSVDDSGVENASVALSAQEVYEGESVTITVTADEDCTLASASFDGTSVAAVNNVATYTLSNIQANTTVVVVAEAVAPVRHTVTCDLTECTKTSGPDTVADNASLEVQITKGSTWTSPRGFAANDFIVYMGGEVLELGTDCTASAANDVCTITIPAVTGDVHILNVQWLYGYVHYGSYSGVAGGDAPVSGTRSAHTETYIPIPDGSDSIAVYVNNTNSGLKATKWGLGLYKNPNNESGSFIAPANEDEYYLDSAEKTVDLTTTKNAGANYIRFSVYFGQSPAWGNVNVCYLYDITNDKFIWCGSSVNKTTVRESHQSSNE